MLEVAKLTNALNGTRYCPPIPQGEEERKLDPFNGIMNDYTGVKYSDGCTVRYVGTS